MLYLKKMVAMILCISVSVGIAQVKTAASEVTAISETLDAVIDTAISEVIALREENVKHFDMGGGKFQAIAYSIRYMSWMLMGNGRILILV